MRTMVIIASFLSSLLTSNTYPDKINTLFKYYQDAYQIYTIEDINKLKNRSSSSQINSETEKQRDGETGRHRDGETEKRRD